VGRFEKHRGLFISPESWPVFVSVQDIMLKGRILNRCCFLHLFLLGGICENNFNSAIDRNRSRLDHLAWVVPYDRADNRAPEG
jgi:hypothetical protein